MKNEELTSSERFLLERLDTAKALLRKTFPYMAAAGGCSRPHCEVCTLKTEINDFLGLSRAGHTNDASKGEPKW